MSEGEQARAALLTRPWEERYQYYRAYKVAHARLVQVTTEIKRAVRQRAGEGMLFVVGPTRAGKSTALEQVVNGLLRESLSEMQHDPGLLPAARMEATIYSHGYNWKDHWVGALHALNEPLVQDKLPEAVSDKLAPSFSRGATHASKTEATLCRCFEQAARQRRLRVFFIDEGHHLTLVPSAKMLRLHLEIIKSVANRSQVLHALFGTYDLLKLRNASGQLGSRTVTVHFDRYRADRPADLQSFAEAALSLGAAMPLPTPPDLSRDLDYCFEISLGCIGILKVWFNDTLGAVLEEERSTLTRADLEKHQPPLDVLDKIALEIAAGEAKLEPDSTQLALIQRRLHGARQALTPLPEPSPGGQAEASACEAQESQVRGEREAATDQSRRTKRRRVGQRAPRRDVVGGGRRKNVPHERASHERGVGPHPAGAPAS